MRRHMLARLHEHGYDDLEPAHLRSSSTRGPMGCARSELASRLGMSKQAVNYLLGQLERASRLGAARFARLRGLLVDINELI